MKKMSLICVCISLLVLDSCRKSDFPPGINEKAYTLKKMVHGTREFYFYFDKKRLLDSVVVINVKDRNVYHVTRQNGRIESVLFINNGIPRWINTDVQYDSAGNMTRFNNRPDPTGFPEEPVIITYDQGHVRSITSVNFFLSFLTVDDTLTYNQQHDVTRWSTSMPRSIDRDVKYYTYDNRYNPLYFIDDLLIVFSEERFLWDFFMSQHNSTSKFYELYNEMVNYENFYDNKGRLVKKRFAERFDQPLDSLTFEYLR
jgi:hypothetical protein